MVLFDLKLKSSKHLQDKLLTRLLCQFIELQNTQFYKHLYERKMWAQETHR